MLATCSYTKQSVTVMKDEATQSKALLSVHSEMTSNKLSAGLGHLWEFKIICKGKQLDKTRNRYKCAPDTEEVMETSGSKMGASSYSAGASVTKVTLQYTSVMIQAQDVEFVCWACVAK